MTRLLNIHHTLTEDTSLVARFMARGE